MAQRSRRKTPAKTLRLVAKGRNLPPVRIICSLTLFLATQALTAILLFWVNAPIHQAPDPLTLQLNPVEYCLSTGQEAETKSEALESLRRDAQYLIPTYTLSFIALGLAVFCAEDSFWLLGLVIITFAVFAGRCDFLENQALEACLDGNQSAAKMALSWTVWKWAFLSFATAATAPYFFHRTDWSQRISLILASAGLFGLLILVPTGKEAQIVHYLLLPLLVLGVFSIEVTVVLDLIAPHQREVHWPTQKR
jgi:uncharacterized membrane protein